MGFTIDLIGNCWLGSVPKIDLSGALWSGSRDKYREGYILIGQYWASKGCRWHAFNVLPQKLELSLAKKLGFLALLISRLKTRRRLSPFSICKSHENMAGKSYFGLSFAILFSSVERRFSSVGLEILLTLLLISSSLSLAASNPRIYFFRLRTFRTQKKSSETAPKLEETN